jgi:hypothetical protein
MQKGNNSSRKKPTNGNGHNGGNGHHLPINNINLAGDLFEVVYLDPQSVHLEYQGENMTFTDEKGTFYPRVTLRRCFPLSSENVDILVRIPESEEDRGRELGILRDCWQLDPVSQESIARELKLFYFVPQIQPVLKIKEEFGFLYWTVMTDRGEKEFIMRDNIVSSTRQISPRRWLLIDINQARYEIHDLDLLDTHSQELVKRYLLL